MGYTVQWRIQDFPWGAGGRGTSSQIWCANLFFAENCMKMKEFGSPWGFWKVLHGVVYVLYGLKKSRNISCLINLGCARFAEILTVFK